MKLTRLVCILTVLTVTAAPAVADRIVLSNGRQITGEIVSETVQEIVIDIGDGMKMTIRRAVIEKIERSAKKPEPTPVPETAPESKPEPAPDPEPAPPKEPAKVEARRGRVPPDFFGKTPVEAWRSTFGRYPELIAARVTRFRAYELLKQAPLTTGNPSEEMQAGIRDCGHGGTLSAWKFRYVGRLELRYGDKVKFIGEITAPPQLRPPLISLVEGPSLTAPRIVVILVKREFGTERYATTTTFTNQDFRTSVLREIETKPVPVRTYDGDYGKLGTSWLASGKTRILAELVSDWGETPRTRIDRFRFRVEWFRTEPSKRPGLDPDLLKQNAVRPLARPGGKVASPGFVAKMWGNEEIAARRLEREIATVRAGLRDLGVSPDRDYNIEWDRIGLSGDKGVTIDTVRARLTKAFLTELLRP